MMTDPIADMLTRVRNANRTELPAVDMPSTHMKTRIAQVLKDEGFILDYQVGKMAVGEDGRSSFQAPATQRFRLESISQITCQTGLAHRSRNFMNSS